MIKKYYRVEVHDGRGNATVWVIRGRKQHMRRLAETLHTTAMWNHGARLSNTRSRSPQSWIPAQAVQGQLGFSWLVTSRTAPNVEAS